MAKTNNKSSIIALKVANFGKKYKGNKNYSVKNASFEVKKGEFHGFIGANGAGKTTTIKSIIGAYAKFDGQISIFEKSHTHKISKKRIGYIPESANFPKTLTASKYIMHMAHLSGMTLDAAKKFSKNALKDIGLSRLSNRKPDTFSSGQKKKLLLAQALINNPDLIIMDEPGANLDPQARNEFFATLKNLQKKGVAIFISSHILTELDQFIDSVTIIDGGKIVYSGKKENLVKNGDNSFIVQSVKSENKSEIIELARKLNLKVTNKNQSDDLLVKINEPSDEFKLLSAISKAKISLKKFMRNQKSLNEAYDYFVRKGSVDTGGQDLKKGRK